MTISKESEGHPAVRIRQLNYSYPGSSTVGLDVPCLDIPHGSRVLVVGGNGAGKSTLLNILGGRRLMPRGIVTLLDGRDSFHDTTLGKDVCFLGQWWQTCFFMNLQLRELLGKSLESERCKRLLEILDVDPSWKINSISDGQRRRCQLVEALARGSFDLIIMDEPTTDLDLTSRDRFIQFTQEESRNGGTVILSTHIFDNLEGWPTHILFLHQGKLRHFSRTEEIPEFLKFMGEADGSSALYRLVRHWMELFP